MNEHRQRMWQTMINIIDEHLADQTNDFYATVGKLEGILDASEIRAKN